MQIRIQPTLLILTCSVLMLLGHPAPSRAQTHTLAWDEASSPAVTGFAVTIDGVRQDYGSTPRRSDGSCNCSIPLPFSSGRHLIVVSAYNSSGETASPTLIVGPTANAGGPYTGSAGTAITVSAAKSTDTTGTISSYVWAWGDGTANTTTSSSSATHTYASAGTFTITLTASDAFPASDTKTTTATIGTAAPAVPGAPASPKPANGATGVTTSPTLTWTSTGATTYDVRFGASNPPAAAATGLTTASYSPATLTPGATYYWQVVSRNSAGSTTGSVWSFTTASASTPPPTTSSDVVIYASDVSTSALHGDWSRATDSTSPNSVKLASSDAGFTAANAPLASPANYVDVPFSAPAGTPYRLWLRLKALNNSKYNDSLWVQFSDARSGGSPVLAIGSTSGLLVNLATDSTGTSINGWGWANGAYWLSQSATVSFASSGSHTIRLQVREDGVQVDQIVLSPAKYLASPPGPVANDSTIVSKGSTAPTPSPTPSPTPGGTGNLLVNGGFEQSIPSNPGPGWVSDASRQTASKSETHQPRSGLQNGACWSPYALDCGMYQDVVAPAAGQYVLVTHGASDHQGGWVGVNVNGQYISATGVTPQGFGVYDTGQLTFSANAGDVIRVWMYSEAKPGYVVIDDMSLTVAP